MFLMVSSLIKFFSNPLGVPDGDCHVHALHSIFFFAITLFAGSVIEVMCGKKKKQEQGVDLAAGGVGTDVVHAPVHAASQAQDAGATGANSKLTATSQLNIEAPQA
ncbi:hypothetical protein M3Y96_00035800 [Aphelenchoides besseyi]|nr:hypothetical protein M3Y96_00035800 [Aphelenchoides besseyi]